MAHRLSQILIVVLLAVAAPALAAPEGEEMPVADVSTAESIASQDLAAADPADDPWLTDEGPAVPIPLAASQEQVESAWAAAPPTAPARAAALRRVRLELGLGDLVGPARVIERAASDAQEREFYSGLARELAPGVPSIVMANAKALWEAGDTGAAVNSVIDAAWAAITHLEIQIWLMENFSILLVLILTGASAAFILLAALMTFPHAAHDLGDLLSSGMPAFARSAMLAALLFVPLMLGEGIVGFVLALFALGFAYGKGRQRNALAMAAVMLVVAIHPLTMLATTATTLLDEDPVLESVLAVAGGVETQADVDRLVTAAESDIAAAHALAYRARRYAMHADAERHLAAIGAIDPADPVMLANLGNIEMRRERTDAAIDYYERAAAIENSPIVYFDLSQAYAASFRMEEYEVALARAQSYGGDDVAALSALGDPKVVADLGLPFGSMQRRLLSRALAHKPDSPVAAILAPGLLGERWFSTASAFALVALFCLLLANRWDHASTCTRCGHRICTRCEETVWSEDLCEDCNHLYSILVPSFIAIRLTVCALHALTHVALV